MDSWLLGLPFLVKSKILSMLDSQSKNQVSQTCHMLRELVKYDHIMALKLPNVLFEDFELRRKNTLRLMFNVNGSTLPYDSPLDLHEVVQSLVKLNTTDVFELSINVNFRYHMFEPSAQDNYAILLEMLKRMHRLDRIKLTIQGIDIDTVLM